MSENTFCKNLTKLDVYKRQQYVENYYGTPRKYVEEQLSAGKDVILEIEIQDVYKRQHLYYYSARISRDISNLIKWLVFAVITGCIVGAASTLFSFRCV